MEAQPLPGVAMPHQIEALTGLAGLLLDSGDSDGAAAILDRIPADKRNQASVAALLARIELEKQVSGLGDFAEAEARVIANPKDLQARYDLALMQNARGMRDQAAESLLSIVKADRTWNEAAARGQLLKFFEAWGPTDETTLAARRKLSSLLFS